jgi:thiazolylpeptide-type bacteriocin precursor
MTDRTDDLQNALDLAGLEIDDLEISSFLDDALVQQSDSVAKVMAASCTTCECCCSCLLVAAKTDRISTAAIARLEAPFAPEELRMIKARDPKHRDPSRFAQEEWPHLIAEVKAEMDMGTPPESGRVQALAMRWAELLHMFTGATPSIEAKLNETYRTAPHPAASLGSVPEPQMIEYISKAAGAGSQSQ